MAAAAVTASSLDETDRRLLDLLQRSFPVSERPFLAIGEALGLPEQNILHRTAALKASGHLRAISAVFDYRKLGYRSALVAMRLPEDKISRAAQLVSAHPGVSHNYRRRHRFNLWFTLMARSMQDLRAQAEQLRVGSGAERMLVLPAIKQFKLDASFGMADSGNSPRPGGTVLPAPVDFRGSAPARQLDGRDAVAAGILQNDLPVESRPFAALAGGKMGEGEILDCARRFMSDGTIRKYSAAINHRKAGYGANAMAAWDVPAEKADAAGAVIAGFREVSHCFLRQSFPPDWPYNVCAMIHGRSEDECGRAAEKISAAAGITAPALVYSTEEFKKSRVRCFENV